MQTTNVFSNTTRSFYPVALIEVYKQAGTFPDDTIEISDADHVAFTGLMPSGKVPNVDPETGIMNWIDDPNPEQL
ncbi:hypothetical protein D3C75_800710 [compost metagenome]